MGTVWNKLLDALRHPEEDEDLDKKIGKEIRNLLKDTNIADLQNYLDRIQEELVYKDILIQLLLEERDELKKDSPVDIILVQPSDISDEGAARNPIGSDQNLT